MNELASFSGLIGDIYDATLDLALWPGVLKRISCFVPGSATTLESKDAVNSAVNVFYQDGGIHPDMTRLYNGQYGKLDPCATDHYLAPVGEPRATADIMPYDEFVRSRIYRELLRPYGWVDAATTALDRSGASIASVTVFRDARDGLIDNEARQRLRILAPHLRRAVLIGKVIEFKSAEAANLADAFDELTAAVLLINADGRIVRANRRALCLLETGDPLSARDGRLFARDPETSRALQAVFASADKGDAPLGVGGIALPLNTQDGKRFVGHALPLTRGARRRAGRVYAAVAALSSMKRHFRSHRRPSSSQRPTASRRPSCASYWRWSRSAGRLKSPKCSGSPPRRSRPISGAFMRRPAPSARPIWLSSSPASQFPRFPDPFSSSNRRTRRKGKRRNLCGSFTSGLREGVDERTRFKAVLSHVSGVDHPRGPGALDLGDAAHRLRRSWLRRLALLPKRHAPRGLKRAARKRGRTPAEPGVQPMCRYERPSDFSGHGQFGGRGLSRRSGVRAAMLLALLVAYGLGFVVLRPLVQASAARSAAEGNDPMAFVGP